MMDYSFNLQVPLVCACCCVFQQEHDRQYMHIGTMVEFAFALVGKLDVINKHSFNDFRLRIGERRPKETLFIITAGFFLFFFF